MTNLQYVGLGIYTVADAARLTGVSSPRIARWLCGYEHGPAHARRKSERVWRSDLPAGDGAPALSFRDLMEVRFVAAFRRAGLSWSTLRAAHFAASSEFKSNHPFSTNRFRTDGRSVFLDLKGHTQEQGVIEICTRQAYFDQIMRQEFKDIEIAGDELLRWWPLGLGRRVVVDPARSFGAPIVTEGVATQTIALASKANTLTEISRWYEIERTSVRDAIEFEKQHRHKPAA